MPWPRAASPLHHGEIYRAKPVAADATRMARTQGRIAPYPTILLQNRRVIIRTLTSLPVFGEFGGALMTFMLQSFEPVPPQPEPRNRVNLPK